MAKYRAWCPDYGQGPEDARDVEAYAGHEAAQTWADHNDARSADYLIVGGSDALVAVQLGNAPVLYYTVSGYASREYVARPAKEPQCPTP